MRRILTCLIGLILMTQTATANNIPIQEVKSPGGITAWLVEDHMVPVVSLQFAVRGGSSLDPQDKAGLANLVASTLDEGAGDLDAENFHKLLEDNSIYLSFSASRDEFRGGVKTLVANADMAWEMLSLAITWPRFDAAEVARVKEQIISDIQNNYSDPQWAAYRTMNNTIFAGHSYRLPGAGFEHTVTKLTPDDLRQWMQERMARDELLVAVSGDITADQLAPLLDKIFGGLPEKSKPFTLPEVKLQAAGKNFIIQRAVPQTKLVMVQPAVARADPDWYPATIINYVLGGGGFNSRLMLEVREKRGLTYGVDTQVQHYDHANIMVVGAATSNETAAQAVDLIKAEWQKMADSGVTAEELKDAQTYLTGALPLALTSTDKIADFVLQLQLEHLGMHYPQERLEKLNAVTAEDVARAAKRLLNTQALTLIAVGDPVGIKAEKLPDPAQTRGVK
ncbi:MAG TPA: peptidase M16 [Rhodospirillaceae bacterium]|nr:peptidase M16 [Rhodospirillaceae bacterium]